VATLAKAGQGEAEMSPARLSTKLVRGKVASTTSTGF
jgi:hypothetical protein